MLTGIILTVLYPLEGNAVLKSNKKKIIWTLHSLLPVIIYNTTQIFADIWET